MTDWNEANVQLILELSDKSDPDDYIFNGSFMIQYEDLPTFGQIAAYYRDLFYVEQGLGKFKNGEFSEIIDEIKILPINSGETVTGYFSFKKTITD